MKRTIFSDNTFVTQPLSRLIAASRNVCSIAFQRLPIITPVRFARRHLPAFAILLVLLLASSSAAQTRTRADDASMPTGATRGAVAGAYALSGFDIVNLSNGKLNFRLPLLNVGGRGGAGRATR